MEIRPWMSEGSSSETRDGQVLHILTVGHVDFTL